MVAKTLSDDSLGKITYDDETSLLTLEWLESTKDMIAPHFQGILYLLAGYALQKKSIKIFIDARKFLFHPSDELVGPWRTKNISPLYNEAGVKKFAFLYPAGSPTYRLHRPLCLRRHRHAQGLRSESGAAFP